MTRPRLLVSALAAAGVIAAVLAGYHSNRVEPLAMAPVDPALCRPPGSGGWASMVLFKAAFAADQITPAPRPEVKPFDYAIEGTSPEVEENPSLWDNLGTLSLRVTTADATVQRYFDQGLTLAFGFNHNEALRAFRKAQQLDPGCAMCYWGEAYVLGPNINAPMDPSAVAPAVKAAARAQELAASATPVEQALIQAMAARYSSDPQADRAALNAAYASAMGEAVARFPDDANVNVLFAESVMDLSPWDYWEAGGLHPKGRMGEAIAALEKVLRTSADHAGAIHLYIHAVEASTDPKRAEAPADRLGRLAPGAGHLVHMPSHIYYRVGRYLDSLEANRQAVAADEAYFARYKASGIYPNAYYPHNVHFLLVSAQMAGDGKAVIESAEKLDRVISNDFAKAVPFVQSMKAAPYFAHVQFSAPQTILALPDPGDAMPFIRAMWHYARGVAQASRSDFAGASAELDAIARIAASADFSLHKAWGVPADEVLGIAQHVVKARVAQRRGDLKTAAEEFRAAAALQDQLPYMEPPYWYYPVRQSLGATLLMSGDLDGAEAAFRESLARAPSNGWSLYGLREVYRKRGDRRAAEATEALLQRAWIGARGQLLLARL